MKARFGLVVLSALIFGISPLAKADPAGSSTAAGGGNTTGVDLDITLTPGKVETRKFEASAQAGGTSDGQKSFQAAARLPVHVFGASDEEFRRGLLLNPGFQVRLDEGKTKGEGRTLIQGTGLGIYRWSGVNLHSTDEDRSQAEKEVAKEKVRLIAQVKQFIAASPLPKEPSLLAAEEEQRAYQGALETRSKELAAKIGKALIESSLFRQGQDYYGSEAVGRTAEEIATGRITPEDGVTGNSYMDKVPVYHSEASGAGELILAHAGYVYDDNRTLGTRRNGALLTPLQAAGHAAFRINNLVNIGFCGAIKPLEILAGEHKHTGVLSSSVEGCSDITVGELPTIRDRFSATLNYGTSSQSSWLDGYRYANSLTLEKTFGEVTPTVGWTLETEAQDRGPHVTRNLFTVGVAH